MEIFQGEDFTLIKESRNVLLVIVKLFDKRRGEDYSNMNIIRFPHYTSALTRVSKLDIVTSQMHRFTQVHLFALHTPIFVARWRTCCTPCISGDTCSPTEKEASVYTARVARIVL